MHIDKNKIPLLDTRQMIDVDRLLLESYGITLEQRMENAGRNLAILARTLLSGTIFQKHICVLAGSGNNGGGGLVAARHLSNWGAEVTVLAFSPAGMFKPVSAYQLEIVSHLPLSLVFAENNSCFINWDSCALIIDAIFGYGLNRPPEGQAATIIDQVNSMDCPVLALDVPSGLDTDLGIISDIVVKANGTLTLGLPKKGLFTEQARPFVGKLYIGDISIPPLLYCQLGLEVPRIFEKNPIIEY